MVDISIFFIAQNIFVITLLFWLLSFLGEFFFKKRNHMSADEVFECGFITTHSLNFQFNLNFLITAVLLILYDLEFFFLLPFLFNINYLTASSAALFTLFIVLILISFIYD